MSSHQPGLFGGAPMRRAPSESSDWRYKTLILSEAAVQAAEKAAMRIKGDCHSLPVEPAPSRCHRCDQPIVMRDGAWFHRANTANECCNYYPRPAQEAP